MTMTAEKAENQGKTPAHLNNDFVSKLTGAVMWWDDDPKATGFGVRSYPGGGRSFFLDYRLEGRQRRFTIGPFPRWSVTAAREEAKLLRKRIDRGEDPASEKRERREAPTVKDLKDRYVADHLPKKAANNSKGRRNDELRMLDLMGECLGLRTKVADVHFGDAEAMHKKITVENGHVRANRVLAIASKAFSLSLKPLAGENKPWRDAAQGNPCKGVERNQEEGKERFLAEAEIAALSDALNEQADRATADCLRLIMVTGCRPGEAMKADWTQMEVEPGYWVKKSAHTKQRKVHKTPLTPPALALLEQLREKRKPNNPHIFPGQIVGAPISQIWAVWYAVRDRATMTLWRRNSEIAKMLAELEAGLKRKPTIEECKALAETAGVILPVGLLDTRPYDLRHTFASVGAGGGLSLPIIGKLLGHTQARTTQRYAHLADDPLREAAEKITTVITGAGKPGADVVPFAGGRRS
jgi:integrase